MSYIITGPTASGKSDFAHKLAKRVNGTIINCDSVQVYRGIETLSASPLADGNDLENIPYKLFSITDCDKPLSAGIWAKLAKREYDDAIANGRIPIFVGGTGFYLMALIDGLSPLPDVSQSVRKRAREFVMRDKEIAYKTLSEIDPVWAGKISANDTQRVARGLEIFWESGQTISHFHTMSRVPIITDKITKILILPDKELLRERNSKRMPELARKVLNEVKEIKNCDKTLPIMKADGILEISKYLDGEIDFETAIKLWEIKICNHNMKHQYTWFKTKFSPDIIIDHVPTDEDVKNLSNPLL